MNKEKDELIKIISSASEDVDMLLDFMELNRLDNLMDATVQQLQQYIADRGLK